MLDEALSKITKININQPMSKSQVFKINCTCNSLYGMQNMKVNKKLNIR